MASRQRSSSINSLSYKKSIVPFLFSSVPLVNTEQNNDQHFSHAINSNSVHEKSDTALMKAASKGQTKVVKQLIEAGESLDLQNQDGYTAFR